MRGLVGFCSVILVLLASAAKAQFFDDFNDGDLLNGPVWGGQTDSFAVNTDGQLQSNAATAGVLQINTGLGDGNLANKEWSFFVRLNFSPSSSNYARIYLATNQEDLTSSQNAYFLQLGESGSADAIELRKQTGTTSSLICRGPDGQIANAFAYMVRVRRDASGLWELAVDASGGGQGFIPVATGTETSFNNLQYFGLRCNFTVSNAKNFYLDNVYYGPWVADVTPPAAVSAAASAPDQVDISFSEPVDQTSAEFILNYVIDGNVGPITAATRHPQSNNIVQITLANAMTNGTTYNLTVVNVEDLSGNIMAPAFLSFTYFVTEPASVRDIVINEFIPDPNPVVNMPDAEFVELYNASQKYINIGGWKITDGSSNGTIPAFVMAPNTYVLLTGTASLQYFAFYPNPLGVPSFPSLNNSGDLIRISDDNGNIIDQLNYDNSWFDNQSKASGGWSLEQVNPFLPCSGPSNWRASVSSNGGTPGNQNSVFDNAPDVTAPALQKASILAADTISLQFSEPVDSLDLLGIQVISIPASSVAGVSWKGARTDRLYVNLSTPLDTGVVYQFGMRAPADCVGNRADTLLFNIEVPFAPRVGDIVINEILFDPRTGGQDYVELYNRTDRTINLQNMALANYKDTIANVKTITTGIWPLKAGEYATVTKDSMVQIANYINHGIGNWIILSTLPTYNNDSSTVFLLMPDQAVADKFAYTANMHFPLLNPDGVSLERIDPNRPSNDPTNWHSAAEDYGFGTPGVRNSQVFVAGLPSGEVSTEPPIFSPDNDAYQDVLNINYEFQDPGNVANIRFFDPRGRVVRTLVTNHLLGTTGTLSWDGVNDDGFKARIGMYVLMFEVWDARGNTRAIKKSVVLGGRL